MKVYPIYLSKLDSSKTVLIGGNHEAERKARELLECDANITLISNSLTDELQQMADDGKLRWIAREYREGDLEGAFLVIVADFSSDMNERVFREAENKGILVNVMDDIPHCTFTFGSMVKRGPLTLSISTSGAAPTLAVRLRQRFEKEFGSEYAVFLEFMQKLRQPMAAVYTDFEKRKNLWYKIVDSEILDLFRHNETEKAYKKTADIVGSEVVGMALNKSDSEG